MTQTHDLTSLQTHSSPALRQERGMAVWGDGSRLLNPVLNVKSFDVAEMLYVVRHFAVLAKVEHADTRVKQISLHNSISRLLGDLLSRISLMISSVEQLSFYAPANRSAQPASVFSVLVEARLFTYVNTLASKVSSVAISPMARYSSAFSCNAVIILTYMISAANIL